jgi:hypothetical protein
MLHPHRRTSRIYCVMAPALIALAAVTPRPAQAQFGSLLKKAKHAVTSSAKPSDDASHPPQFDEVTVELVPTRVTALIKGLQTEQQILAGTNGNGVDALTAHRDAVQQALTTSHNQHDGEFAQYDKLRMQNEDCRETIGTRLNDKHAKEIDAAEQNGTMQGDKYAAEMQAALKAGDLQKLHAIQQEMMQMAGNQMSASDSTNRADSIMVEKQCGPAPTPPAFIAEQDSLETLRGQLDAQIRSTQQRAQVTGARTSGLNQVQFAMAIERVQYYFGGSRWAFTKAELAALDAHKDELKQAMSALQLM